jgi:hypothetical protein
MLRRRSVHFGVGTNILNVIYIHFRHQKFISVHRNLYRTDMSNVKLHLQNVSFTLKSELRVFNTQHFREKLICL